MTARAMWTFPAGPLALIGVIAAGIGAGAILPSGWDWSQSLRPATLMIAHGHNPYTQLDFFNPPWLAVILLPLALLPVWIGRGLMFVFGLIAFLLAAVRCGADRLGVLAVLLSPLSVLELWNSNIDWLVLLALFVPARWGLLLAALKPQVGGGLIVWWAVEAWRDHALVRTFAPLVLSGALSLVLFGLWPLHAGHAMTFDWNWSLFPWSLPLAAMLLTAAIRRRDERAALAAGAFAAPYVLFYSYIGALIALSGHRKSILVTVGLLWALIVWRWWGG